MALPTREDLKKLKDFTQFLIANPTALNLPQLDFFKKLIESFGGHVPDGEFNFGAAAGAGGKCPFGGKSGGDGGANEATKEDNTPEEDEEEEQEVEMDSESESELELDMDGVIEGDAVTDQPMGDSNKTPSDEEIDQASDLRSQAAAAYSEQKFQEAIDLYTKAIELNPGNALFHAKRGQAFLKLKKPNACIRDCDKALELNCDSAAAYKFRGRAHRLLGNWEDAAKDLRQACKLDFDEEADEWLREVQPNAKKIEQHRIKQERRKIERTRKTREAANRKAREEAKKQQSHGGGGVGGFEMPGGGGFMGNMGNMGDFMADLRDPELMAALQDIMNNPANIEKYKSNPKICNYINLLKKMGGPGGGGMPGFPGFPGAGAAAGEPDLGSTGSTPPPETASEPNTKAKPQKSDFVDDGLD